MELKTPTPPEPLIPVEQSEQIEDDIPEVLVMNTRQTNTIESVEEIMELFSSERMVFFSDAVIAISLTLLILPLLESIQAAREKQLEGSNYVRENSDVFSTFLLSYVVITEYWRQHEMLFHYVRRYTKWIRTLNPIFLFFVVTLPISTTLATELASKGESVVPLVIYVTNMILIDVFLTVMYILVRKDHRMWDPNHRPTTAYGLLLLAIKFIVLLVILVLICLFPNPTLLYAIFSLILVKPMVEYFQWHGSVVSRFGKMVDHYIGY